MIVASVAAKNNYPIPIGCYVLNASGQSSLDVDKGAGFVPLAFGVGFTTFLRTAPGTPATVNDAGIGFTVIGVVPAGWVFRFRWLDTVIGTAPISVAKTRLPKNYAIVWNANSGNAPNAVTVPELTGYACEFWRQTGKPGGKRGASSLHRDGRRYIPYYRGAVGVFEHPLSAFSPFQQKNRQRFKVCYYDAAAGARSRLSADTIVVCAASTSDAVNGRNPVRTARSVWIE
jgi:hypothetical protein